MDMSRVLVLGSQGQLGTALQSLLPTATFYDRTEFDVSAISSFNQEDWSKFDYIINAAAMTNVDGAETPNGRELAWKLNADAVALMAITANQHDITLIHVSSDYVFDGTNRPHTETESFTPLSTYGASKAAGDIAARCARKHYIIRTTWVVGKGKNFITTMWDLAYRDISPNVVNDQIGRLTFTDDLALAIKHLISSDAAYGTYNMTNDGDCVSWADIAQLVFHYADKPADNVTGITTDEYFVGKSTMAKRPLQSEMDLTKIKSTGFAPRDWRAALDIYIKELKKEAA